MNDSTIFTSIAVARHRRGLFETAHNFIAINMLERIRNGGRDMDIYSCDYNDMNK